MRRLVFSLVVTWFLGANLSFASMPSVIEAERAELGKGIVIVRHPNASGGAFVEAQTTATLQFTVNAPKPMQVRVIPKFWRNSVKTPPRFFPYPLPTLFGPDAVVALGNRIYFTAPASGQIGIVDAKTGELIGSVQIGGYLTDIVADEKTQRLFVADAWNGRIVAVDAATNRIVAQAKVPQVWSLELHNGKLFAVSRHQRQLFVLDATTLKTLQTVMLPAPPIHVAVSSPNIFVRFEPFVLPLPDFVPMSADRIDYGFGPRTVAEFGPRNQVGWKRFATTPQGLRLTVRTEKTEKGDESRIISLPQNAKPVALATSGNRLLVATDKGLLVILDMATETPIATLKITDRAFDVITAFGKVYATDPTKNRVVVVDADKGQIVKAVGVPDEPVALEAYEPHWWTQDFAPQPLLFVACRKAKAIAVISLVDEKFLSAVPLPFEPALVHFALPPDPIWWGTFIDPMRREYIPADRIAFELTPRLVVAPALLAFDVKTLAPTNAEPFFTRRNLVPMGLPDGIQVIVVSDNSHTLNYRAYKGVKTVTEKWIDTSAITDRQGVAPVIDFGALKIADQPWQKGIWMTPDQQLFLVADTDEFWQWNAPVISLRKGINRIPVTLQRFVQLDALRIEPVPPFSLQIIGETTTDIPERYRAVFYADEPIRLRLTLLPLTRPSSPVPSVWLFASETTWAKRFGCECLRERKAQGMEQTSGFYSHSCGALGFSRWKRKLKLPTAFCGALSISCAFQNWNDPVCLHDARNWSKQKDKLLAILNCLPAISLGSKST